MNTLTIGCTVHYTDNPVTDGGHVRCFEATVTDIHSDGSVDIDEHLPGGVTTPAYSVVEQGKPGDLYTWHWPEPTDGEQETNALLHYITGGQFL